MSTATRRAAAPTAAPSPILSVLRVLSVLGILGTAPAPAWAAGGGPTLVVEAPASVRRDGSFLLAVRVEGDPGRVARSARLVYVLPGAMGESTVSSPIDRAGRAVLSVALAAEGARAGTMLYRVELLDERGGVAARRGEAKAPLSVELRGAPEEGTSRERPWYRRWYLWAAVGVIAAIVTTASVLSATGSGTGSSDVEFGWSAKPLLERR